MKTIIDLLKLMGSVIAWVQSKPEERLRLWLNKRHARKHPVKPIQAFYQRPVVRNSWVFKDWY
jgi:hypothetical protein